MHFTKTVRPERIIQFGEGGFLRGFADWMIHKITKSSDFNGSVVVVQPIKEGLCDTLTSQNCVYTHLVRGKEGVESEIIDVTGVDSNNEIVNIVSRLVSEKKYGAETALRVELTGYIDPRFIVPKNLGSDALGLYSFELIDKTVPLYGTEGFKRDMSVKGEVYRQLLPLLQSDDEEQRLLASRAFREALAALESRDIET